MFFLDATCPLVSKVDIEAKRHFEEGREIVLIGHAGKIEVIGTMGQLPAGASRWCRRSRRRRPSRHGSRKLAYVTQTTSVSMARPRSSRCCAGAFRRSRCRIRKTSSTRPPPAGSGEEGRADRRCNDRDRCAGEVQLRAAGRGRAARGLRRAMLVDGPTASTGRSSRAFRGSGSPPASSPRPWWTK